MLFVLHTLTSCHMEPDVYRSLARILSSHLQTLSNIQFHQFLRYCHSLRFQLAPGLGRLVQSEFSRRNADIDLELLCILFDMRWLKEFKSALESFLPDFGEVLSLSESLSLLRLIAQARYHPDSHIRSLMTTLANHIPEMNLHQLSIFAFSLAHLNPDIDSIWRTLATDLLSRPSLPTSQRSLFDKVTILWAFCVNGRVDSALFSLLLPPLMHAPNKQHWPMRSQHHLYLVAVCVKLQAPDLWDKLDIPMTEISLLEHSWRKPFGKPILHNDALISSDSTSGSRSDSTARSVPGLTLDSTSSDSSFASSSFSSSAPAVAAQTISVFELEVASLLRELGVRFERQYQAEFSIDIACPEVKVAIEIDGPSHFLSDLKTPNGPTVLKRRLLTLLGWTMLSVNSSVWGELVTRSQKMLYIRELLNSLPNNRRPEFQHNRNGLRQPSSFTHTPRRTTSILSTTETTPTQATVGTFNTNGTNISSSSSSSVLPSSGRRNRSPSPTTTTSIQDGSDVSWLEKVEVLELNHQGLTKLQNLNRLTNLRRGSFVDNEISKIEGLESCRRLEELSLEENLLVRLEGLSHLKYLKKLDLGKNRIVSLDGLEGLDSLSQLALEDNEVSSLSGLANLKNLMELYIGNNRISDIREIHHLKEVPKLIILDVSGNGLCQSEEYRLYIIFHLKAKLKVLDGISVDTNEQMTAKEKFSGKLTLEVVEQKLMGRSFKDVRDLDLSACRIREVDDIFNESTFPNLRDLNLDNNMLTSMRCFGLMPKLQVLHLNHNKLETLSVTAITDIPAHGDRLEVRGLLGLPSLEVLQLSHNHLIELSGLQVARLRELKILWLHNNELTKVEGLEHLVQLRELTLDKNRIRALEPHSFVNLHQLRELRLEENGLRSLSFFLPLPRLQSLFLAFNRITDVGELEKLAELPMLVELTLSSNPVARKQLYRPTLVRKMPTLKYLDGREIIMDERERVEMLFASDGKPAAMIHYQEPVRIQSQIQQKVPVKLTSLNFEGLPTLREKSPTPPLSVGPMLSSMMPHSNAMGMSVGGIGVGMGIGMGMNAGMGVGVSPAAMLVLKDTQAAAHQWQNSNTMSLGMSAARQEQLSYQPMSQSHHIQASFEGLDVSKSDVVPRRDRVDRTGITRRPSSGGPNMHSRGVYAAPVSLIPSQTASRPTVPPPSLAGNGSSGPYMLFNAAPTSGSGRSSIPISMSTQTSSKPPVPDSPFLLKSNTTFSTANKPAVGSLLSGSSGRRLSNPLRSTQSPRPFPISKR
eukprot:GILJ01008271.1.p1 GENE.GILJ01008271.1~~GILJ01008271.1.p1  ORF type:complete len:1377 (+),score=161.86 GILJ01008271.1:344-4132(+)